MIRRDKKVQAYTYTNHTRMCVCVYMCVCVHNMNMNICRRVSVNTQLSSRLSLGHHKDIYIWRNKQDLYRKPFTCVTACLFAEFAGSENSSREGGGGARGCVSISTPALPFPSLESRCLPLGLGCIPIVAPSARYATTDFYIDPSSLI